MACCVFVAFVIATILAWRDRILAWRQVAIVGLGLGVALALLGIGLHHQGHDHLSHGQGHAPAEARE